jgi:phosphate transport system substrate-binding protein
MNKLIGAVATVALLAVADQAHAARDYVWAAGSSTVFPFSTRVAENYAKKTGKKSPKIEALGTGGGIKMFCGGAGEKFPDIAIVVASNKKGPDFNFKLEQLYLGLADQTLRGGKLVKQPYKTWSEVGPGLPNVRILAYGPPPTSGTRDAWVELAIEGGAAKLPTLAKMKTDDEKKFKATVSPMRTDGGWVDAGENDNAIVGTIEKTPNALGVFGYSFLEENGSRIKGATINGVKPTAQTIASGQYPLSRSLYIYVKKSQVGVTPGLKEFVAEFVSDAATGRGGYLQSRGMIPLPPAVHVQMKQKASALTPMPAPKN